jgi:hypothetical protein
MMATVRLPLVLISLATMSVVAHAQTSDWAGAEVYPGYPGSFLVTPQRSDFTAPAIYRTVNDRNNIGNPVGIAQLCRRDVQALINKGIIHPRGPVAASGVQNDYKVVLSGKIGLDAKIIKASVGAEYDQIVSLSTGPVQVFDSDEDNVGRIILANIGRSCQRVIESHLRKQRAVFVAETAIQAYDYDASIERVAAGTANAECGFFSWCRWFGVKGEVTGRLGSHSHNLARNAFVTIAMVPAEFGDRQSVTYADIGRTASLGGAPVYAFAPDVHGRTRVVQHSYKDFRNWNRRPNKYVAHAKARVRAATPSTASIM